MKVIVDTDPGIDDAAAIFMAFGSKEIEILALTTVFGNVSVDLTTANAVRLLELVDREDIPVYRGASRPLLGDPSFAPDIHGSDGLGGLAGTDPGRLDKVAQGRAVDALIKTVLENPGEVTILALGPLTNVALALSVEPRLAQEVARIVYMGGAILTWGNATPSASANLFNDAEAAKIVVRSGAPLTQVGLDVCRKAKVPKEVLDTIGGAASAPARLLTEAAKAIREGYERRVGQGQLEGGAFFNDMPCVAYLLRPRLFEQRELYVDVEVQGDLTRGSTVADFDRRLGREPNVGILLDVDGDEVASLFRRCVLAL